MLIVSAFTTFSCSVSDFNHSTKIIPSCIPSKSYSLSQKLLLSSRGKKHLPHDTGYPISLSMPFIMYTSLDVLEGQRVSVMQHENRPFSPNGLCRPRCPIYTSLIGLYLAYIPLNTSYPCTCPKVFSMLF